MKKVIAFLSLAILLFALSACGGDNNPSSQGGVSQALWNKLTEQDLYDNVTFTTDATFLNDYDGDPNCLSTAKLDGENACTIDDGNVHTGEDIKDSMQEVLFQVVFPMLEDYDTFSYNKDEDVYTAQGPLTYNATIADIKAKITVSDISVVLDEDQHISTIRCEMTQNFVEEMPEGDISVEYILAVEFTFSDYGTTVVE